VLDHDEAVFGVLEGGDEEAADETEDDDVALHDGVAKKYNGHGAEVVSPGEKTEGPRRDAPALSRCAARFTICIALAACFIPIIVVPASTTIWFCA
jgi:hypothetical protein